MPPSPDQQQIRTVLAYQRLTRTFVRRPIIRLLRAVKRAVSVKRRIPLIVHFRAQAVLAVVGARPPPADG